ncbi:hypothetical protein [uncultured Thiodictyon sp.]|jgi:hypothetical protein|uniref:hypothetical protein n=1 Tax=uncultured Thiodictyon sp. TaxID=1846217 RepID=UPI0025E35D54|nr:hypothetical protein [uncultured Thiodictyon sp.]
MLKMVGASGQLSLGKQYARRYFEVEVQPDGGILLRPMRVIPGADAWLYGSDLRERLAQADVWMAEPPPCETDLEALAARLDGTG